MSAKFQDTIDEVAGKLHDHYEKNQELKNENAGYAEWQVERVHRAVAE